MRDYDNNSKNNNTGGVVESGISFGCALVMVISYTTWHSIGWAILHGFLSWIYVIYYVLKY